MGAQAWPFGGLCPGPAGLGCGTRFAQTVLASILSSGPGRSHARRRPGYGAMGWRATTTRDEGGRPHEMRPLRLLTTTTLDPRLRMSGTSVGNCKCSLIR